MGDALESKAKYKNVVDINANQCRELQEQLELMKIKYQEKLDAQSKKFTDSSTKTTKDAQSKLIESYKNIEEKNEQLKQLQQELEALKSVKSINTKDQVQQFRMEQIQKRSTEMEQKLKEKDLELEQAQVTINQLSNGQDVLFDLMKSYRSTWKEATFYPLIYELLFNILMTVYDKIQAYEQDISSTLCDKFCINKSILYESFYNEWIKNSNYQVFLSSTEQIGEIKDYIIDTIIVKDFIFKHLQLESHQIAEDIHLKFASFIQKCINISWKMVVQHPLLRFTPNKFHVEQLNKIKYHKDLHDVCYGDEDCEYILYYIWPIISHNNFHSIVDSMKIKVCLGNGLSENEDDKGDEMKKDEDVQDVDDEEDDEDVGMMIINHDDNDDYY